MGLSPSAATPIAVFFLPWVLCASANDPIAVLSDPVRLFSSALSPTAVLAVPVVLNQSASIPKAVLAAPVVLLISAPLPPAVLRWSSLSVGFGGPPQLGVTPTITRSPAITRLRSRFIESSWAGQAGDRTDGGCHATIEPAGALVN